MSRLKKYVLLSSIFLLPIGILATLLKTSVHEVSCQNQYGKCSEVITKELENVIGLNIISARKKILSVAEQNFLVKNFSLSLKLPSNYVLHLVERKPVFALENAEEGKFFLIDNEGKILSTTQITSLPKLKTESELPEVGEAIKDEELFSLKLISRLYFLYKIKEGAIKDGGLTISFEDRNRAIFPLSGDKDVLLGSLILILNKLKDETDAGVKNILEDKESLTIDLRYKNPVIF